MSKKYKIPIWLHYKVTIPISIVIGASVALYQNHSKSTDNLNVQEVNGQYSVEYMNELIPCNDTPNIVPDQDYVRAVTACTNAGWYGNR